MRIRILLITLLLQILTASSENVGDIPLCEEERIADAINPKWTPWDYYSCGPKGCLTVLQGITDGNMYLDCGWGEVNGYGYGYSNWVVDSVGFREAGEECAEAGQGKVAKWEGQEACRDINRHIREEVLGLRCHSAYAR